jgi:hypothetical protein
MYWRRFVDDSCCRSGLPQRLVITLQKVLLKYENFEPLFVVFGDELVRFLLGQACVDIPLASSSIAFRFCLCRFSTLDFPRVSHYYYEMIVLSPDQ